MFKAFKNDSKENGDKATLYPRQKLPDGYERPKPKQKQSVGLFDLLKSDSEEPEQKSGAGAAFAAFTAIQRASISNEADKVGPTANFVTQWKSFAIAKRAEEEGLARRVNAVLKNVNMQGFKQASMATTWRIKFFWLGLVLFLMAILTYEIVKNIQDYQNSPVTTKFTLQTPDALDFPQVYLCYGSGYNRTYLLQNKDKIPIVRSFRDRAVVIKGGRTREKRDLSHTPNMGHRTDPTEDEDINRILMESTDYTHGEEDEDTNAYTQNDEDPEYEIHEGFNILNFGRVKRDIGGLKANLSANETKAAEAKARAEENRRINALMFSSNISEIAYEVVHDAGFKVEETFLECEFNGYTHHKLDCQQIVRPIMDANYGMCFLVALPDDMKQAVAGQGLRLVLNSHVNLYPRGEKIEGAPKYAGILVSVNRQYDPFNWLKSLARPGYLTKIDLDATYVELLNLDSGSLIQPCVDDDAGSSFLKIYKGNYSRTLCQMDCVAQAQRNTCDCVLVIDKTQIRDDVIGNLSFCGPRQFNNCLAESANITDALTTECRKNCYTPCKSYRYEMRSSSAQLNEAAFSHLSLPPNVTTKQLVELRVAYSRKEIAQMIQKESASAADLISNLGGQINLWMGASIITLLQMFFMGTGYLLWRMVMKCQVVCSRSDKK